MKRKILSNFCLIIISGLLTNILAQPMSGTYNIPADYATFNTAVSALVSNGIDGSVIFNVAPGNYQEQFIIPQIPGASEVNTITFTGTGTQDEAVISFAPDDDNPYIVRFNGAKHIRFNNMSFTVGAGATYGFIFHIQNSSEDIEITNNILNNLEATTAFYTHILVSNSNLMAGEGDSHDILIANNIINDGFTAVRCNGTAAERLTGIEIRDNIINQPYSHGIWLVQNQAPIIEGNVIDLRSEEPVSTVNGGMNLSEIHGPFLISKNKITNPGAFGIQLWGGITIPAEPSRIINNSIGGGFRNLSITGAGIRIRGTVSNLDIQYNSINLDYGDGAAINIRVGTVSGLDIRNNSFAFTGIENGYAMYISNTASVSHLDHNNYHSTSDNFVYYGTNLADLSALQAVNTPPGNDANSREGDPVYNSPTDLLSTGTQLFAGAVPIPGIDDDIEGNLRDPVSPCIGAYEFDVPDNDLAAINIEGPSIAYLNELTTYTVTIRNTGVNTQDDFTVKLMKEGEIELASVPVTVSLADNEIIDVELDWIPMVEEITFVYGKVVLIGDEEPDNDETDILDVIVIDEGLMGTYSINWDGTGDYVSFSEALDDLIVTGINGPVIFEVHPGNYTEQLLFDSEIPNASEINTVTFLGHDNAVLHYSPAVSEDRYVIRLDGAKHLIFDNLTIEATDTASYGWTVHIMDNCENIEFTNCHILTDFAGTSLDFVGIVISGSTTSATTGATNVSEIKINNNTITGGYRGIHCWGVSAADNISGLQISGNYIYHSRHRGLLIQYASSPLIQHNTINMSEAMGTSHAMYLWYIYDGMDVSYNVIKNAGQYGINISMSPATAEDPIMIYNNMIGGGFRVASANGIYLNAPHTHVIYNSILMDFGTQAALRTMAATSSLRVINNSFAYMGPGNGYAVYYTSLASILESNYNNYYSGTSDNLIYLGGAFDHLGPLQDAGHDLDSHIGDPMYISTVSPFDLHAIGPQLYQRGTPIPGIIDDIDGDPRHEINPCIGADEYTMFDDDLSAMNISGPVTVIMAEPSEYTFTVMNEGENTQSAYTVQLLMFPDEIVLGSVDVTDEPLEMGETAEYSFIWIPDAAGQFELYGKVILAGDENPANDETSLLTVNVLPMEPPLCAVLIYPEDDDVNVPLDIIFEWAPNPEGPATDGYFFGYWQDGEYPELEDVEDVTEYAVTELEYGTLYHWQVIPYILVDADPGYPAASDINSSASNYRAVRERQYLFPLEDCPVWSFTTVAEPFLNPPQDLTYEIVDQINVHLTWEEPEEFVLDEFRYDDGVVDAQLGFQGDNNSVMGAVHRRDAEIHEVTWLTTSEGGPHHQVNVFIFGLDAASMPDRDNLLYHMMNVPNADNQWNHHILTTPVSAPDGFLVGLSFDGFLGLATDDGIGPPWEFVPNTQFGIFDYTDVTYNWTPIEFWNFEVNFLIRAYGLDYGDITTNRDYQAVFSPNPDAILSTTSYNSAGSAIKNTNRPQMNSFNHRNHNREVLGYNVYRDGMVINPDLISETSYIDPGLQPGTYVYYVTAIYVEGESEPSNEVEVEIELYAGEQVTTPLITALESNYPNPFNPDTTIGFTLREAGFVTLEVFNILGQKVTTLVNGFTESGYHKVVWNGRDENNREVSSGIYFYRMKSGDYSSTKKMILLK